MGEGETSKQWLQQEQNSLAKLCLSHMQAVASHVLAQHPGTTPLVWDDMLRDIPKEQLKGWQGLVDGGLHVAAQDLKFQRPWKWALDVCAPVKMLGLILPSSHRTVFHECGQKLVWLPEGPGGPWDCSVLLTAPCVPCDQPCR